MSLWKLSFNSIWFDLVLTWSWIVRLFYLFRVESVTFWYKTRSSSFIIKTSLRSVGPRSWKHYIILFATNSWINLPRKTSIFYQLSSKLIAARDWWFCNFRLHFFYFVILSAFIAQIVSGYGWWVRLTLSYRQVFIFMTYFLFIICIFGA